MQGKSDPKECPTPSTQRITGGSDKDSTAMVPYSNMKAGSAPTWTGKTLQHAVEGIQAPLFRGIMPQKYLYRYDARLVVPPSQNAVAQMIEVAKTFWLKLLEINKTAILAPWSETHWNHSLLITKDKSFPTMFSTFHRYFMKVNPNS